MANFGGLGFEPGPHLLGLLLCPASHFVRGPLGSLDLLADFALDVVSGLGHFLCGLVSGLFDVLADFVGLPLGLRANLVRLALGALASFIGLSLDFLDPLVEGKLLALLSLLNFLTGFFGLARKTLANLIGLALDVLSHFGGLTLSSLSNFCSFALCVFDYLLCLAAGLLGGSVNFGTDSVTLGVDVAPDAPVELTFVVFGAAAIIFCPLKSLEWTATPFSPPGRLGAAAMSVCTIWPTGAAAAGMI